MKMRLFGLVLIALCILYLLFIQYASKNGYSHFANDLLVLHALLITAFGGTGLILLFSNNEKK
jgi:hypothetical protein